MQHKVMLTTAAASNIKREVQLVVQVNNVCSSLASMRVACGLGVCPYRLCLHGIFKGFHSLDTQKRFR